MSVPTPQRGFVTDLVTLLRESALEVKAEYEQDRSDLNLGKTMAYHEVLSLIETQSVAFGFSKEDVGLSGFDADTDLL